MAEAAYSEGEWTSADGLTLRYRDYVGRGDRPPVLCIPGLTRNARDFEPVARAFAGEWRVICPDLRGRGQSDYARDPATYTPVHYVADIMALLDQTGLESVVAVGTSLGGIVSMLIEAHAPGRIAAAPLHSSSRNEKSSGRPTLR